MERGLLIAARQSLKQNEESFHFTTLPLLFTFGTAPLLAGPSMMGGHEKAPLKGRSDAVVHGVSGHVDAHFCSKKELMERRDSQFS